MTDTNATLGGKCLCGAIQFTVMPKTNALNAHVCHCDMCRRHSGSASMTMACQGPPTITSGENLVTSYKSSEWGQRSFCATCGTHLFVNAPSFGYYGVSAGSLDLEHHSKLNLEKELYIDKKPAFYELAGDHTKLTEAEFLAMLSGGK